MHVNVNQKVQVGDAPHRTLAVVEQIISEEYVLVRWQGIKRPPFLVHHGQLSRPGKKPKEPGHVRGTPAKANHWNSAKLGFARIPRKR